MLPRLISTNLSSLFRINKILILDEAKNFLFADNNRSLLRLLPHIALGNFLRVDQSQRNLARLAAV